MDFINKINKYIKLFFEFLTKEENHHVYKLKIFCFLIIFALLLFFSLEVKKYLTSSKELYDEGIILFSPESIYYNITGKNKLFTKPKTNYSVLLLSRDKRFSFEYKTATNYNESYLIMTQKTNFERKVFVDKENKKYFVADKNYTSSEYKEHQSKKILKNVKSTLIFMLSFILVLVFMFIKYLRDVKLGIIKINNKNNKNIKKRKTKK